MLFFILLLYYKDCYISRKLEEQTGSFYNQTIYSAKDKKNNPIIPLKQNLSVETYGGYSGENKAYFTIVSYQDSKNELQLKLIGIPILEAYKIASNKLTQEEYITRNILDENCTNLKIIKRRILKYQEYIDLNGEPMCFLSNSEIKTSKSLIVSEEMQKLIYKINNGTVEEKEEIKPKMEQIYMYLLDKLEKEYKVYKSAYEKLLQAKDKFLNLEFKEKVSAINGIIDIMQIGRGSLQVLGLSTALGRKTDQSFNTNKLTNMIFCDKSVTGMYERRYKNNGMENSNC